MIAVLDYASERWGNQAKIKKPARDKVLAAIYYRAQSATPEQLNIFGIEPVEGFEYRFNTYYDCREYWKTGSKNRNGIIPCPVLLTVLKDVVVWTEIRRP